MSQPQALKPSRARIFYALENRVEHCDLRSRGQIEIDRIRDVQNDTLGTALHTPTGSAVVVLTVRAVVRLVTNLPIPWFLLNQSDDRSLRRMDAIHLQRLDATHDYGCDGRLAARSGLLYDKILELLVGERVHVLVARVKGGVADSLSRRNARDVSVGVSDPRVDRGGSTVGSRDSKLA
ncbi:hypothetical protein [Variovorax sp. Sphag1AA]|uniref:hypothetical protein n=1 Tax=Variovorax sp. Sphag1AA TaxID=2587027 RepID=UPI001609AAEB|nr:hypothetical protein [Variovorax sp. Sphag1AA]MBB3180987.1 hypothetical protein [Variovorax sp. Sphag1AA]